MPIRYATNHINFFLYFLHSTDVLANRFALIVVCSVQCIDDVPGNRINFFSSTLWVCVRVCVCDRLFFVSHAHNHRFALSSHLNSFWIYAFPLPISMHTQNNLTRTFVQASSTTFSPVDARRILILVYHSIHNIHAARISFCGNWNEMIWFVWRAFSSYRATTYYIIE